MTWSVSAKANVSNFNRIIDELRAKALSQNAECGSQFNAAAHAARYIIETGAVGEQSCEFNLTLTGHSNPNHQPRKDWANDMVSLSISQV